MNRTVHVPHVRRETSCVFEPSVTCLTANTCRPCIDHPWLLLTAEVAVMWSRAHFIIIVAQHTDEVIFMRNQQVLPSSEINFFSEYRSKTIVELYKSRHW